MDKETCGNCGYSKGTEEVKFTNGEIATNNKCLYCFVNPGPAQTVNKDRPKCRFYVLEIVVLKE